MKEIDDIFCRLGKKINKYSLVNGEKVVETNEKKYIVKNKESNNKKIYDYLLSRKFDNFLRLENDYNDPYEVYEYIEDKTNSKDKAIDLVYLLSILHTKTTTYQEIDIDRLKKTYEETTNELEYLNTYYHNMQDYIESKVYMSPAEYLLIRNISNIYKLLFLSRENINKWYKTKKELKKERTALTHNNLSLNNFIDKDKPVFRNWDKSQKDCVVYDFYNFYRNEYKTLEFSSLFEIYQRRYKFTKEEMLLFNALVFKVWKVELNKSNYDNCVIVNDLVIYINKTMELLLKKDEEYQKTDENKLNQENDNI